MIYKIQHPISQLSPLLVFFIILVSPISLKAESKYTPLEISEVKAGKIEQIVNDTKRNREIPVLIYLPTSKNPAPVILFSHGLGGSRKNSAFLGHHWARRGYICVFMQHKGSDNSLLKGGSWMDGGLKLLEAADKKNFILRVDDTHAVIDQLGEWNQNNSHPLFGRLNLDQLGMAGHSFGAQTTEAVSGEQFADGSRFKDERIKAALAMSPGVIPGNSPEKAFGNVAIPWFLMTGTEDALPPFGSFMEKSALIFRSLPPGEKYKLILEKGNHFTFAGNRSAEAIDLKSPNHLRSIAVLSTAFWDAYLKNESTAKEWLNGNSPSLILDKEDQWFKK